MRERAKAMSMCTPGTLRPATGRQRFGTAATLIAMVPRKRVAVRGRSVSDSLPELEMRNPKSSADSWGQGDAGIVQCDLSAT